MFDKIKPYHTIIACSLLVLACSQTTTEGDGSAEEQPMKVENPEPEAPVSFSVREPNDEELNEFGIIEAIEDAGYPMYNVTVSFPERQMSGNFSLNAESASLSHELSAYQDHYATLYYESEESNEVLDIIFDGKSLLGEYAPEDHEGLTRFDGVLKGADRESGDLPASIKVVGAEDELDFAYFVDAATVGANNQPVTVYYYTRYVEVITYLELSEN
jgi:hypothetical protein